MSTTPSERQSPFTSLEEVMAAPPVEHIGICGLPGTGKTHTALTIYDALANHYKHDPSEVLVQIINCDKSLAKLVSRGLIPEPYRASTKYAHLQDWPGLEAAVDEVSGLAADHSQDHGSTTSWVIVDNAYRPYRWCRDQYALDTHGLTEVQLAKIKRRKAIADPGNQRGVLPTFDQMIDYGTIKPMFTGTFWDPLMFSGANLIVTFPTYEQWDAKVQPPKLTKLDPQCQDQVFQDLADVLWLRCPPANRNHRFGTLIKRTSTEKDLQNIANMDMTRLLTHLSESP